jgi:hypothetical protein
MMNNSGMYPNKIHNGPRSSGLDCLEDFNRGLKNDQSIASTLFLFIGVLVPVYLLMFAVFSIIILFIIKVFSIVGMILLGNPAINSTIVAVFYYIARLTYFFADLVYDMLTGIFMNMFSKSSEQYLVYYLGFISIGTILSFLSDYVFVRILNPTTLNKIYARLIMRLDYVASLIERFFTMFFIKVLPINSS